MTSQPAISVLMPVRDAWATVIAAMESVRAQTFTDWELVIVDDGSQDGTTELLKQFAADDDRIVLIRQEPKGIAAALQRGCDACRGEFIARMDADDVMDARRLEVQRAFLVENADCGLVSCRVRFGGTEAGYAAHVDWVNSLMDHDSMSLRRFVEAPVAHSSVMFRRELIEKHGGYREGEFPEDYELWLRWLEAGVRFGKMDAELLTWNDPPQRLSRTDARYSVEAFYAMKCLYMRRWLETHAAGREIWLWGAGRVTRRRFDVLADAIAGFIDVDEAKRGTHRDGRLVRLADDLPEREKCFILAGVGARGAREAICEHLTRHGWIEGGDFLLAA
ncbi:MAG TPA: glycosyl transferase family 2 [Verrucomicrobiales bacterium]|nr:glycosyl transferase family 2 [Verrucomicrobiales bacterium]